MLGVGPVGLLGAMALVTAGFTTYVYSRELPPSPRIDLVEAIGATYVSSQATAFPELAEKIGNIDLIYEAVGHSHFALEALRVLGTNGIFVLTGVPGLQAFIEADPARLMRDMVLRNQVLLGTVNAGPDAFAAALADLDLFRRRWPAVVPTLIAGRYPPEQAPDLILGRPAGHQERDRFRRTRVTMPRDVVLIGVPTNSSGMADGVARAPAVLRERGLAAALVTPAGFTDAGDLRFGLRSRGAVRPACWLRMR